MGADEDDYSNPYDFDFTDEASITLGSGDEFLLYDSDEDDVDDYFAGTVGAQILDVYGTQKIQSINGTINFFNNESSSTIWKFLWSND